EELIPALLEARDPIDLRPALGRDLSQRPPPAAAVRSLDCELRTGAAREARARLARAPVGRGAPLPRPACARARCAPVLGPAAKLDGGERRRNGDSARRRGARRVEAPTTTRGSAGGATRPGGAALERSRRTGAFREAHPAGAPKPAPGTSRRARATPSSGTPAAPRGGRRRRPGSRPRPSS